ncbi:MAG: preprotein translocase subunit SecA [Minisyncoccus archaeiphilus]|uniref:preprotein translocase subunit SecA n=1 Tax=Minisyncoccus archaeiphilus TaxID=3238481 RepID=UPI0009D580C5|nr:MAG: preprotein translocase subunit SecA [Parcubacteria group bacterium ADurb.Bin216]GMX59592.1 MAG: preprotein translocase subunit SecA [Candidatus Parcubacteria bacterium]
MSIKDLLFGDANKKFVRGLQPTLKRINELGEEYKSLSDEDLKKKTALFKERLDKGETLDSLLPEAFAVIREASSRNLKQRHYDVQLIGGIVLHQGKIAEMKTGEGKTLTATSAAYLNAIEGKGCHVVTVNDYLSRRDAVWMGQLYYALGLSTSCINHDQSFIYDPSFVFENQEEKDKTRDELGGFKVVQDFLRPCSRKEAYAADITYGTNNEFGFDYLKDNMAYTAEDKVQRGHNFAVVDEVDSILIDEARTPLIISAPDTESSNWYGEFAKITPQLNSEGDYEVDEKLKAVTLTEQGIERVEKILGLGNIYNEKGIKYVHHLEQALKAEIIFKLDKDYVVRDGEIVIVDQFTGRLMPGRRWSNGLHQAIEAKEGVKVQPESLTLASVTFQNYFRLYKKLSGMTGTAETSAEEFDKVYHIDVIIIPTNRPLVRKDLGDRIYKDEKAKFNAVVAEIKERHKVGQPVLVGTTSINKNELLSLLLQREGIPHKVLNAKNHEEEGAIIAQAGRFGAVTIATNMAGRGVDILLGGNPSTPEERDKVVQAGGLHVIGTERHEARRIDNQLRGRAGRQGDPGSTQFYISLDDDVVRIFGGDNLKAMMERFNFPDDIPIENPLISRSIESAQSKIEGANFDSRKYTLEYDDVLNKHRDVFYKQRQSILDKSADGSLRNEIIALFERNNVPVDAFEKKEQEIGSENMRQAEKIISLRVMDIHWTEHLENMEYLRDSVRLRAYGQRDPLVEYKKEGNILFRNLVANYEGVIINSILNIAPVQRPTSTVGTATMNMPAKTENEKMIEEEKAAEELQEEDDVGRNELCPCGSGLKYKKCCGK